MPITGIANVVPAPANFNTRQALYIKDVPPSTKNVIFALYPKKYDATSGIAANPFGEIASDTAPISGLSGQTGGKPTKVSTVPGLGLREVIYFKGIAPFTQSLKARLDNPFPKYSITIVYTTESVGVSANYSSRMFTLILDDGKSMIFDASVSGSPMRITVTGVATILQATNVPGQRFIVSIICDALTGVVKVYVNGVLDTTLNGASIGSLAGDLIIGSSSNGGNHAHAYLGQLVVRSQADTAAEVLDWYNFLNAAFAVS